MSTTDQLARVVPYIERVVEDKYIQDEIGQAITELRRSARRLKGQSASEALKDRKLRSRLADAAGSLTKAGRALAEQPAPKRRRLPLVLLLVAGAGVSVLAWQKLSTRSQTS
jgi:hypothetical protein